MEPEAILAIVGLGNAPDVRRLSGTLREAEHRESRGPGGPQFPKRSTPIQTRCGPGATVIGRGAGHDSNKSAIGASYTRCLSAGRRRRGHPVCSCVALDMDMLGDAHTNRRNCDV